MSDPRTALGGAEYEGLVSVKEMPAQGMITLRADLSDAAVGKAVKKSVGLDLPEMRHVTEGDGKALLWMSPDELMVLCAYSDVPETMRALEAALGGLHALVADVSDARAMFALSGAACRDVLAKLTPADLRPATLPTGELRRTRVAQVAGAFWLGTDDTMRLICFRSVAQYMFDLLKDAANPDAPVDRLATG